MSVRQRRLQRRASNNPLVNNRRRRQEPAPEPDAVQNAENAPVAVADRPAIACVDLTEEEDDVTPSIVDLTSPADNSVIVLSSTPPVRHRPRPLQLFTIDTDDIEVLHHTAATVDVTTINLPRPQLSAARVPTFGIASSPVVLSTSSSAGQSSSVSSGLNISCPICMDTHAQIIARNDVMMSTVCGHVFCKKCITATIVSQHLCPTCRRKLTAKSIHPVFL